MTSDNFGHDDPAASKAQGMIDFKCHACGCGMSATVREIGCQKQCPECRADNSVPLPKIKVGGGSRAARPKGLASQAAVEEPVPVAKPVLPPAETAPPAQAETAPAEPPVAEAPPTEPPAAPPQAEPATAAAPLTPEVEPSQPVMAMLVLLVVTAGIGWAAVSWGPGLLAAVADFSNDDVEPTVLQAPPPSMTIGPDQLQSLVGLWKSTRLARQTIEADLNVTLAEFEARGMADAAATVRKAIASKEDDITAARDRFAAVLNDIATVYAEKPGEVEELYSNVLASQSIRSDPEAEEFLRTTAEAIKTSPPSAAELREYFD